MTTQPFEAVLVTGPTETRYRRAGAGAPVLLLFAGGPEDPLGARLFQRLADRFRVIAPDRPAGVPLSKWLRDLIDGLGLHRPCLVADDSLAVATLEFSLLEHDRVGGVVAIHGDADDDASAAIERIAAFLETREGRA